MNLAEQVLALHFALGEEKDSGVDTSLKQKAKESGIPYDELKKIFLKGEKEWESDPDPKYNKYQLGHVFVDNYIKANARR